MATRIFYPHPLQEKLIVTLNESTSHYLLSVLRFKIGEPLIIFNGQGGSFTGQLHDCRKKIAIIKINQFDPSETESPLAIHLAQVISRGERMDFTVQKAVELGVSEITPLISERCNVRLNEDRMENRLGHWTKIAISASEQSGRCRVPTINPTKNFSDFLQQANGTKFICDPSANLSSFSEISKPIEKLILIIGAEGGFSDLEINQAKKHGVHPLWLGPRILRTETAALVALTVIQSKWGDLG